MSEERSPVLRVVDRLFALLDNVEDPHWATVRARGFPRQTERLCITNNLRMIGSLLIRIWDALQQYPTRTAKVCPGVASEDTRIQVSGELKNACDECLDRDFAEVYRNDAFTGSKPGVLSGPINRSLTQTFERAPVANLLCEDRFSRVKHANASNSGNHGLPSTVSSDHVLNESKLLHFYRMESSQS